MLKVWGRSNSVNVQKVVWCLAEIGIEFERRDAGREFGINDQDWFLRLNPNGKVPLLQDGDFALWESNTIVRYLSAKYDFGGLCPSSVEQRADAERWMDWALSSLSRSHAIAFWNLIRTPAAERNMGAVAKAVAQTNAAFSILDQHLATRDYVIGTELTMGDIPIGAIANRWFSLEGIERLQWPHLRRWYQHLTARSAFQQHVMLPLS